jgi:hypothetical protein
MRLLHTATSSNARVHYETFVLLFEEQRPVAIYVYRESQCECFKAEKAIFLFFLVCEIVVAK